MTKRAALAVGALAAILVITSAWWMLALWPASETTPAWLERTRAVCFGVAPGGLPSTAGWLSLIGEPLGMIGFLLVVWGGAVKEGLAALRRSWGGRLTMTAAGAAAIVGFGAVGTRVHGAPEPFATSGPAPAERVDRAPPPLALVDQRGDSVHLADFHGRPVLLTFAYGHCETVCPANVKEATDAVRSTAERGGGTVLLVVTLDPWRDTPSRLGFLAEAWDLPPGARALGGSVGAVLRTLNDWGVAAPRDARTGEVVHQSTFFLIGAEGRVAFTLTGPVARGRLREALGRL